MDFGISSGILNISTWDSKQRHILFHKIPEVLQSESRLSFCICTMYKCRLHAPLSSYFATYDYVSHRHSTLCIYAFLKSLINARVNSLSEQHQTIAHTKMDAKEN